MYIYLLFNLKSLNQFFKRNLLTIIKKFIWFPLLLILALPNSLFAETSDINAGFIDLADSPAPGVSSEEDVEDTETISENTEE